MKFFKTICIPACSFMFAFTSLFFLFQGLGHAEMKPMQPSTQRQLQMEKKLPMEPAVIPLRKLCPDLKVSLNVAKTDSGLVTLSGVITNVGNKDYDIASEAQCFMNLSYPPKTYNQIGVSEQLLATEFSQLKKGASLPVNVTYQVPNFHEWVQGIMGPQAKRLFTLRVVKKDMSSFNTSEECNPANNSISVEVAYNEKQN